MNSGILGDRMAKLVKESERQLTEGIAPLSGDFLAEHQVTLDEAYTLADWLALACRMLLEANREAGSGSGLESKVGMDRIVRAMVQ